MTSKAQRLLQDKNHDYSSDADPLANLRACELLDIPAREGVLIRLLDKVSRLHYVSSKGTNKVNESIEDSCIDIINYVVLFAALCVEKGQRATYENTSSMTVNGNPSGTYPDPSIVFNLPLRGTA